MKAEKQFKGKAIYNPSGRAGEYSYWACNFYTGCSNNCEYCYCKTGAMGKLWSKTPQLKKCFRDSKHAMQVFDKELHQNIEPLRHHGLFFSFTTDPLAAECSDLTWEAVMLAMENSVPVKILTKIAGVWVQQVIENMNDSWKPYIAFGFTLTGHDDLEPGASIHEERITAMMMLKEAGFKIFASIEPIIDVDSSLEMMYETQQWCDLYKVGLLSGAKYDRSDLYFMLSEMSKFGNPIYIKDSFLEALGVNREELPSPFVGREYNLFNSNK